MKKTVHFTSKELEQLKAFLNTWGSSERTAKIIFNIDAHAPHTPIELSFELLNDGEVESSINYKLNRGGPKK